MFTKTYYYLFEIEYLGYRFHGWQKQPKLKTLQFMIDRTLNYILEGRSFKTLGAGRTDAMVSAQGAAFELFLKDEPLQNKEDFLIEFNKNLPQDIRAKSIKEVDRDFNVIQDVKEKEYLYLFAHGDKFHPFCAPIMTTILDKLDIDIMIKGARLFEGQHDFRSYCYQPNENGDYIRTIKTCVISENDKFRASFFPKETFLLKVIGSGFGRNQIRLMMGALIDLGKHKLSLQQIEDSLKSNTSVQIDYIAPASGLILNRVEFE